MNETVVLISYRSQPDQSDAARREIRALIATVLANEPECGGITLLQDADDPTRFTLIEQWPSREAYRAAHAAGAPPILHPERRGIPRRTAGHLVLDSCPR